MRRLVMGVFAFGLMAGGGAAHPDVPQPDPAYRLRTVAGTYSCGETDGGAGGRLCNPMGLVINADRSLTVLDAAGLRRISTAGVITTVVPFSSNAYGLTRGAGTTVFLMSRSQLNPVSFLYRVDTTTAVFTLLGTFGEGAVIGSDGDTGVVVADTARHTVHRVTADGAASVLAGSDGECGTADGSGVTARFCEFGDVAVADDGTVYLTDNMAAAPSSARIRKITRDGVVSTLAMLTLPWQPDVEMGLQVTATPRLGSLALDGQGHLLVVSRSLGYFTGMGGTAHVTDARILRVSPTGQVAEYAGYLGDSAYVDGPVGSARLFQPDRLEVAADGTIYFVEPALNIVRTLSTGGVVSTVAGTADGLAFPWANPGHEYWAGRSHPRAYTGLVADANGTLHFIDAAGDVLHPLTMNAIVRVTPEGVRSVTAGRLYQNGARDGTGSGAGFDYPRGLARGPDGHLYVGELEGGVRQVTAAGQVTTVTPSTRCPIVTTCFSNDRGAMTADSGGVYIAGVERTVPSTFRVVVRHVTTSGAVQAFATLPSTIAVATPGGLAADRTGNFYMTLGSAIYKLRGDRVFERLTGGEFGYVDGALADARFREPRAITVAPDGSILVSDGCALRRISTAGVVSTLAGHWDACNHRDGPGSAAWFENILHLTTDAAGNVYVTHGYSALRKVTPTGVVTTVQPGPRDGRGLGAIFQSPTSLTRGPNGRVYVGDGTVLREVTTTGDVTTVAGLPNFIGSVDGEGESASFQGIRALAADASGVWIADGHAIRRRTAAGRIETVAGRGDTSGTADGGSTVARFNSPRGVAVGGEGRVYVADSSNNTIRVVATDGSVTTLAGSPGEWGAVDGQGTAARFREPVGIAVGTDGALYVADSQNAAVRRVSPDGRVTTFAGKLGSPGTVDGARTDARFMTPVSIVAMSDGGFLVGDQASATVRRISPSGVVTSLFSVTTLLGDYIGGWRDGIGQAARMGSAVAMTPGDDGAFWILDGRLIRHMSIAAPPTVVAHPASVVAMPGVTASFAVVPAGDGPFSYQWEVSSDGVRWDALEDGTVYAGTRTTTLTVAVRESLGGARFRCVVSDPAGAVSSNAAQLTLRTPLSVLPSRLVFAAVKQGSSLSAVTVRQTMAVGYAVPGGIWTARADRAWLQLSAGQGAGSGTLEVEVVNPGDVIGAETALTGTITLVPVIAPSLAITIPVTMTVEHQPPAVPPVGQVDTPTQGATGLQGAFGVTGWVVDDIGVQHVRIYRQCLSFDNPDACQTVLGADVVFLGDASVIPGARPDVETLYPHLPASNRAGWGFLILSNLLPNIPGQSVSGGGEGAFTLYAVATDVEGRQTLLGRTVNDHSPTTVTVANSTIGKPFGAIDTPGQGATVSGTLHNFGWVLTPDPGTGVLVPVDGATINVFIDGAVVGQATYNLCRGSVAVGGVTPSGLLCNDDVSTIFRGGGTTFRNLDAGRGPIGLRSISTTALTSGLHTISWGVTDSANRSEGIGSRYFNVLNAVVRGAEVLSAEAGSRSAGASAPADLHGLKPVPYEGQAVFARTGYDLLAAYTPLVPNTDGVPQVRIPELGRVELLLPGVVDGALVVNGDIRDLPIGVGIDPGRGIVTWAPGPGYLGTYSLAFVARRAECGVLGECRVQVDVTVAAGTPADERVKMHLERADREGQVITVHGWSLDPQAATGSGIGAVHLWATSLRAECGVVGAVEGRRAEQERGARSGCGPVFLGVATLGIARPDVAAAHGAQFPNAGIVFSGALPDDGAWDVTAYVWVSRTGRFEDARTLTVKRP